MSKLLLIDGNALMHRAYHALPPFKTSKGVSTNMVYGFFSVLHKCVIDYEPSHLLVCFDTPARTFRNELYEKYQAQRPKVDDDFIEQIPLVKEAVKASNIIQIEKDGYEADDLIGTISHSFQDQVLILTGDKDIMQLVNDHIIVVSPQIGFSKSHLYNKEEVWNKLHVFPSQIPDYKALAGDPSDNYPGAKGIGPITAQKLIKQYETVENLYSQIDGMDKGRIKNILMECKKDVLMAKKLAIILTNVEVPINPNDAGFFWVDDKLNTYLLQLEMYSLSNRIFKKQTDKIKKKEEKSEEPKPQLSLF